MTSTIKKRLCWNCEGYVSFEEENCPFCSVYLNGTAQVQKPPIEEEEPAEVYQPYKATETTPHQPPYTPEETKSDMLAQTQTKPAEEILEPKLSTKGMKTDFIPLLLLLSGSLFFLFGMILLLFSNNGTLTLKWNASVWFIYLIIGAPLLLFGWRYLNQVQDQDPH